MVPARNNRPCLGDIHTMPGGEVAKLPAEHLALLQEDADAALNAAKRTKEWLEGAITLRYADAAAAARRAEGKNTGLVRFEDGTVVVAADLPKKIDWDQNQLAALLERIRASGENPGDYVDIGFKVPERKYTAWPEAIVIPVLGDVRREQVVKPIKDATLDDIAFALLGVEAEFSAVGDRLHALRKLYGIARQAGARGSECALDVASRDARGR